VPEGKGNEQIRMRDKGMKKIGGARKRTIDKAVAARAYSFENDMFLYHGLP